MIFPDEAAYRAYLQDVKTFLWREIDPLVPQIEAQGRIPFEELRPKFRQHGLFACLVPEAYGGLGLSATQYAPVLKELAKVHGGIRAMLHVHNSSVHLIETGRPEQRQQYLPRMAQGDLLVCFALTEPDSGSGLDSKATAVRQGDVYLLNGRKHLITNAREAELFAVFCFTQNPDGSERAFSVLLVERGMPGFTIEPMAPTMGCVGASHEFLRFEQVPVPRTHVLGEEGRGSEQMLAFLEISRVFIAVAALGTAERALELALEWAKRRVTFGKPIASRQAVQGYLAEMATDIYALRHMVLDALRKYDAGQRIPEESSMCKLFALEAVGRVTDKALLVHGGLGYLKSSRIEMLYRDARLNWLEEGTPTIHKLIIARTLLQEEFAAFGRGEELL
ncbi:MAG: acyl-CoA dehydrogenase [Candidatus Tectimicrobiota bacterium]|nr:MAG: acyl-CoA dehydrogenase [Candidatus Tectomicrobia bacterium]